MAARSTSAGLRDWALKLFDEAGPCAESLSARARRRLRRSAVLSFFETPDHSLALPGPKGGEQLMHKHAQHSHEEWTGSSPVSPMTTHACPKR